MLTIFLLVLLGFIFTKGFFSNFSISVLVISFILLFGAILGNIPLANKFATGITKRSSFWDKNIGKMSNDWYKFIKVVDLIKPPVALFLLVLLSTILYGGLYQSSPVLILYSNILLIIVTIAALFLLLKPSFLNSKTYWAFFLVAVVLRLFMIWSSPDPLIDVFVLLKEGAINFLAGVNPYTLIFPQMYEGVIFDYYAYPPGTLLLTAPFVWFFNDPRYALFVAEIFTATLVLNLIPNKPNKYFYPLMLLYNPVSLYVIEQSYIEPLVIALLISALFFLIKKSLLASILITSLALNTKQYFIFFIPLIYKLLETNSRVYRLRLLSLIVGVAMLITLPFYLWSKPDFIHDVIAFQYIYPPRYESLTVFSLLHNVGFNYNFIISMLVIVPTFILIYLQKRVTISRFFYLSSLLFFTFFLFNKWAFINYYYLVSQLLLIGIALEKDKT